MQHSTCCAARRKQSVNAQNAVSRTDSVLVHFERVLTVFEIVRDRDLFYRQFFRLANRDKSSAELVSERRCKDKPARFDTDNGVDLFAVYLRPKSVNGGP